MAELDKIAAEYQRHLRNEEWVKERLGWEDWKVLGQEAAWAAAREMERRHRGPGEVLPGGYDADSIAAQAVAEMLEGKGRVSAGFTRTRLVKELKRLISRRIRPLNSLKETRATSREWEMELNAAGEEVSVLSEVGDPSGNGFEIAVEQEEARRRERMGAELEDYLKGEPELAGLFRFLWAGVTKPEEIARRLGIGKRAVEAARNRLERRLARFAADRGGAAFYAAGKVGNI